MASITSAQLPAEAVVPPPSGHAPLPVQDELLHVCQDLSRLRSLLADSCAELTSGLQDACTLMAARRPRADADTAAFLDALEARLSSAVLALQFEDLASQLIDYSCGTLNSSAERLATQTKGSAGDCGVRWENCPRRPNPVTQLKMEAGSVELF